MTGPWGGGNKTVESLVSLMIKKENIVTFDLKDRDIDVIFCMDPRPNSKGEWYQNFINYRNENPRTKIVQRVGDVGTHSKPELTNLVNQSTRISDFNIFPSTWAKDYISYEKENYAIIPNRPKLEFFNFRKHGNIKEKVRIVTHHWSTNPKKGFDVYEHISRNRRDIEFTYIGRLPENIDLENTKKIEPMNSKELARELPKHDIYLTASVEEAGANHVLEAMAAGLPVIYHSSGGSIPEYCNGYGIEYSSISNLDEKIDAMVSNFKKYKKNVMSYNQKIEDTIEEYGRIICEIQGKY